MGSTSREKRILSRPNATRGHCDGSVRSYEPTTRWLTDESSSAAGLDEEKFKNLLQGESLEPLRNPVVEIEPAAVQQSTIIDEPSRDGELTLDVPA